MSLNDEESGPPRLHGMDALSLSCWENYGHMSDVKWQMNCGPLI